MAGSLWAAVFGTNADATNNKMGNLTFADGAVVTAGTGSGLTFGGAANQKIGEFGGTPVVQPASVGELLGFVGNAAVVANFVNATANGNLGTKAYSFGDIVKALKQAGIIASS